MVNLSKTSKMPCKSWSLPAGSTCPGAYTKVGMVKACQGCYAMQGFYRMPAAKKVREDNRDDWKLPDWVNRMVAAIGTDPYFRWFDSGDAYHPGLIRKIHEVVEQTPKTLHWMPTRSYRIKRLKKLLDKMRKECDNIVIRYSSNNVDGTFKKGLHGSTIIAEDQKSTLPADVHVCPASQQEGRCDNCRACWTKTVKVVAYVAHTRKMEKIINGRT